MNDETKETFARQAEWQHARVRLPWSVKLEMALTLRDAALAFRRSRDQRERGWTREEIYGPDGKPM